MNIQKSFPKPVQFVTVSAILLAWAGSVSAANIYKTNNTDNLNLATSWTNGVVPGASDIAIWDSTVSDPNNTTNTLGANVSWAGIKIINPSATILMNAGNTVTLGASGIDMTAATADLALSNAVTIGAGALQQWNVASGRTLSLLAVPNKPGQPSANTGVLQIGTTGTVKLGGAAVNLIIDNQNNPWATYGLNDWAALDGSGNVIAATYTDVTSGLTAGVINNIVGDLPGGSSSAVDVSALRFNDSTFHTLNIANSGTSRTCTARGILVTANCVGGLIGGNPATSFIRPARVTIANTSFNVIQNSPADFTIAAIISNGSSSAPTHVVKSGSGNLIISGAANGYSGGTDINGGTLTVGSGATLGGGTVTVNNTGRLMVNASNTTFVASLTVNSGATNSIKINTAGAQQYISRVTFNADSTRCEFNYIGGIAPSLTVAPLLVSNITANDTIGVDVYNTSLSIGTYPLIKYTNSLTGTGFGAFALGFMPPHVLGYLSNDTANTSIDLVVTNVNQPIHWAVGNSAWDINSSFNWLDTIGNSTTYQQVATPYSSIGDSVLFNDTASGSTPITVSLNTAVSPASMVVSNNTKAYAISGTGGIGGIGSLTKTGNNLLTLSTENSFSGGLNLTGGSLNFAALTNLGAGAISFGGGALQYASGNVDDISLHTVNFNSGGATIDVGANSVNFANPVGNGGVGGLTKSGSGTLILNGTNRYTGATVIANGTLALGGNTYISNTPSITVSNGALLDVASSGIGLTLNPSASQVLAGVGTIYGNVVCPTSTRITPGTSVGALTMGDLTMSGGTNVFEVSTTAHDLIIAGNLAFNSGTIQIATLNTLTNGVYPLYQYSGVLLNGPGSSGNLNLTGFSQAGKSASLSEGTGEIDLVIADNASDVITWSGTDVNWDTIGTQDWLLSGNPWGYTNGDFVTFDEIGVANPTVYLQAVLLPGSVTVSNETAAYTFADGTGIGGGKISGSTRLTKKGPGMLIIQTDNNNSGPTDIQNGTVQVGNGGIGDIGTGNITNNGALIFAQNANRSVSGVISGAGPVTQQGSATLTLQQNNTYSGVTTISSGTLQAGTGGAAGSAGTNSIVDNGTFAINHSGSIIVPANISGSGSLRLNGSAAATVSSLNTYQGNTYVDSGSLKITGPDLIPDANTVSGSTGWLILDGGITTAGTFDMNGFNETINALSGTNSIFDGVITNSGGSPTTTNLLTVLGSAGTTYNGSIVGNPNGSQIALTLLGASELRLAGNCSYTGPTLVGSGATLGVASGYINGTGLTVLSNGATFYLDASSPSVSAGNAIFIPDNSVGIIRSRSTANTMGNAATVSGGPAATNAIANASGQQVSFNAPSTKQFQNFLGTVVISNSQSLRFSSTTLAVNGGDNTTFQVDGSLNTRNGTASGAGISLGALSGTGSIGGSGNDGNALYVIGAKGLSTVFSGAIVGTPPRGTSIIKTGAGTLTLNGSVTTTNTDSATYTNYLYAPQITYVGTTTISNGVLSLVVPNDLTNSTTITLAGPTAVLDASQMGYLSNQLDITLSPTNQLLVTNGLFEVFGGQTLRGIGAIWGKLLADGSSIINPGLPTDALTVTNGVDLESATVNANLNRTNASTSSQIAAAGSTTITVNGGTLNITNLGPDLVTGDVYHLFNKAIVGTGFDTISLPVSNVLNTIQYAYQTNLFTDGTIKVLQGVSPLANYSTNITATVSGNTLTVSWPWTHAGWELAVQTNSINVGLANNWVTNYGTASVTSTNFTINPNNGSVFYRLVHP